MDTFEVRLSSPGGVYAPGDTVEGVVIVPEKQLAKATCVRLRAIGMASVEWTDTKLESRTGFTPASVQSVAYKAEEEFLDLSLVVWSRTEKLANDGSLRQLPFSFDLPAKLPPSFNGTHGSIRYICEATLERKGSLFKSDKKASVDFTVGSVYDLSAHPQLRHPQQTEISEQKASTKGHFSASVTIPRGGFVAGEHVPLSLVVSNSSKHNVARVELTLIERVSFIAFSNARARLDPHGHFTGRRIKEESTTLATVHQPLWVPSKSVGEHQVSIIVPTCNKSFKSAYIRLRHHVALVSSTEKRIVGEVPIVIGSVPLNSGASNEDQPPAYSEKDPTIAFSF